MLAYLADLLVLGNAAEEGKNIVLMMLATGLVFCTVIAIGEAARYLAHRRAEEEANRPL